MKTEALTLFAVGAAVLTSGWAMAAVAIYRRRTWRTTVGQLVRYEEDEEGARYPVIRFSPAVGTEVTFRSDVSGSVASQMRVRYSPDVAQKAEICGFFWSGFAPIAVTLMGAVMIVASTTIK